MYNLAARGLFISFVLDTKETEPKKKSGLHFQSYSFRSRAKPAELASLKQHLALNALSVNTLYALTVRPIHVQFTMYKVQFFSFTI